MENIVDMMSGKLLSYGISGFALLMIGLTYYLMKTELKRDLPRHIAVKTIWMFMGLVILSTVVVGFFSVPLADKNEALNKEVDGLTTDMSQLMVMVSKYEFALNDLAFKLEKMSKPPASRPPRNTWKKPTLNTALVAKHVDLSKIKAAKMYKGLKHDKAIRLKLKDDVKAKLIKSQGQLRLRQ